MTRRRTPTPRQVLQIVMRQVRVRGGNAVLTCPLCPVPIWPADYPNVIREHLHALGIGGEDDPDNEAFVHRACADRKTTGRAGASKNSSAGDGDISRISKVARLRGETGTGPKATIPARVNPWPKGRRLSNPKFKRRFDGTVERKTDAKHSYRR